MEARLCSLKYLKPNKFKDRALSQTEAKLRDFALTLNDKRIQQLEVEKEVSQLTPDYRQNKTKNMVKKVS